MTNDRVYRLCAQCGGEFYIKGEDQRFFAARNLELPKRCFKCRKENKAVANQQIAETGVADNYRSVWSDEPKTPAPAPEVKGPAIKKH